MSAFVDAVVAIVLYKRYKLACGAYETAYARSYMCVEMCPYVRANKVWML